MTAENRKIGGGNAKMGNGAAKRGTRQFEEDAPKWLNRSAFGAVWDGISRAPCNGTTEYCSIAIK
ncbi:MAG: hypothetical protein GY820_06835 [Gammaproteobacteria bacterium]|nr:hypothetical protein [Gammaproteobacteria bacterium]